MSKELKDIHLMRTNHLLSNQKEDRNAILALGINSFATLMFEVVLLKQFSFLIGSWNYILSIVLCSLMVGIGIGALLVVLRSQTPSFGSLAFLQGVSAIVSYIILMRLDVLTALSTNLIAIGLVFSGPFLFFGYLFGHILSDIRRRKPSIIRYIYASDLIGAALGGLITAFVILPFLGINKTGILSAVLFFASALLFIAQPRRYLYKLVTITGCLCLIVLFLPVDTHIERWRNINDTPLHATLERGGEILFTGWSPLNRIDAVKERAAFTLFYDGFPWTSIPLCQSEKTVSGWSSCLGERSLKAVYPFLHDPAHVLIIGVGAGPDVLFAHSWFNEHNKQQGATEGKIIGVEIDPLVISLMRQEFSRFNSNIFNEPNVAIVVDDARHFLETTKKEFDLIHYPGVDTPFAFNSVYGINPYVRAENYLYTVEGLYSAYQKLSATGILVFTIGSWFSESPDELDLQAAIEHSTHREARILAAVRRILEKEGIRNWHMHVEVVGYAFPHGENSMMETMMRIGRRSLRGEQVQELRTTFSLPSHFHYFTTEEIIALSEKFEPITDDAPFYYNYPLRSVPQIVRKPFTLSLIAVFAYLAFCYLVVTADETRCRRPFITMYLLLFFVSIGCTFMLTELFYAHQAMKLLHNSFLGSALIIPLLLFFSGIGSIIIVRYFKQLQPLLFIVLLIVPVYNYLLSHIMKGLPSATSSLPVFAEIIIFILLLAPLALMLGVFFPLGFLLCNKCEPHLTIAWFYIADILGSISGILLGVLLPIRFGYARCMHVLTYAFIIQIGLIFFVYCLSLKDEQVRGVLFVPNA